MTSEIARPTPHSKPTTIALPHWRCDWPCYWREDRRDPDAGSRSSSMSARRLWIKPHQLPSKRRRTSCPCRPRRLPSRRRCWPSALPNYTHASCSGSGSAWPSAGRTRPFTTCDTRGPARSPARARRLLMIGQVLGHASATTTAKYAHLVDGRSPRSGGARVMARQTIGE